MFTWDLQITHVVWNETKHVGILANITWNTAKQYSNQLKYYKLLRFIKNFKVSIYPAVAIQEF